MSVKLKSTIVNDKNELIGFMAEGKQKDFGYIGTDTIQQPLAANQMIAQKFHNSQVKVVNGRFMTLGDFKFNQLDMGRYDKATDSIIPIQNTFEIIKRYVKDNENVGFLVRYGNGSEAKLTYANIVAMSSWFRPVNFDVRTSQTGKYYIAAKPGMTKVDDLPAEYETSKSNTGAKRTKSAAKAMPVGVAGQLPSGYDILQLFDFVDSCHGALIFYAGEKYIATTPGSTNKTAGFTSLNIGDVASAKAEFNSEKLNVNSNFKKVGQVIAPLTSGPLSVITYVNRKKSVFLNGENHIKRLGVALPSSQAEGFRETLAASLAIEEVTDPRITGPVGLLIDASRYNEPLKFFDVDVSNLDLISKERMQQSILSEQEIEELVARDILNKMTSRAMTIYKKETEEVLRNSGVAIPSKPIKPMFAGYSDEDKQILQNIGIDLYTGGYNAPSELQAAENAAAKAAGAGSTGETVSNTAVEIEYSVNGLKAYPGKAVIDEAINGKPAGKIPVPANVSALIKGVAALAVASDRYKKINEIMAATTASGFEISRKLWLHNATMYIQGNKMNVFKHDSKDWTEVATRAKTGRRFEYKDKKLTVDLTGVTI